jgi:CBS domain-containing protein
MSWGCPACGVEFESRERLAAHAERHRPVECADCGARFETEATLQDHLREVHGRAERPITRAQAVQKRPGMTCEQIMTRDPRGCPPSATVRDAARIMRDEDVGIVPVVVSDIRRLLGVVTDRDLCLRVVAEGFHPNEVRVADCLSAPVVTCRPQDDVATAAQRMQQHQIRRIMVVDDAGRLVGVIAQADLALKVGQPDELHRTVREISRPDESRAA